MGRKSRGGDYILLCGMCALVIGLYGWSGKSGGLELGGVKAEETYYNLLVQGFCSGQLNLKREVPPDLARLLDSGDAATKSPYWLMDRQLLDLSYYRGKLFLYFGVTPALMLFWPYVAMTGRYVLYADGVVIFFSVGFLGSVGLLWLVWRRYFAEVRVGVVVAGVLGVGLVSFTVAILQRCDVYEVAISCGCALTMVTLLAVWRAMHGVRGRAVWLAGASLAYGLAVGARPSLLVGAVILLVPVAQVYFRQNQVGRIPLPSSYRPLLLAAVGPMMVMGLGLLLYNYRRFEQPLEFGQRYQLPLSWHEQFSVRFLWSNIWVGFLAPARWSGQFPFVHDIGVSALPRGRGEVFEAFGVLSNLPVVWLALAVPLVWHRRRGEERALLRWWVVGLGLLFGATAGTLCLHDSMWLRYEVELLLVLVWLAVLSLLGLERALAGRGWWHLAARWSWGLVLAFSVAFNLFVLVEQASEAHTYRGIAFFHKGQLAEAVVQYQKALKWQRDNAEAHSSLGLALLEQGKEWEALWYLEEALRLEPEYAEAHNNLGNGLFQLSRVPEALGHFEAAVRLKPEYAEAHNNLAGALFQLGRVSEALGQYEQVLRLRPDYANAHHDLGVALFRLGRVPEALGHYAEALRLKADYAQAHSDLGLALFQLGRVPEALGHFEAAVELQPGSAETHNNLGIAQLRLGKAAEAIGHLERAVRLQPDFVNARSNLTAALFQLGESLATQGKWEAAIPQYRRIIEVKPDHAPAYDRLGLALSQQGKVAEAVGYAERACELTTNSVATYLDTLGVAYAEAGRFSDAIVATKLARDRAEATGQRELARQATSRLKLYESKRLDHQGADSKP